MDAEEIRLVQARWVLGTVYPERLVAFACDALAADVDSPALRVLAGESQPMRESAGPLLERALSELGFEPMDEEQAKRVVARSWAARIVSGAVAPYDGAKAIWQECCDAAGPRGRLDAFLSLASEHEDFRFAQESNPAAYDEEIRECERQILREAQLLLKDPAVE